MQCMSQVPEILSPDILAKMHAPPKPDVPVLDLHDLPNADGFVFGFPTRCRPCMEELSWINKGAGSR